MSEFTPTDRRRLTTIVEKLSKAEGKREPDKSRIEHALSLAEKVLEDHPPAEGPGEDEDWAVGPLVQEFMIWTDSERQEALAYCKKRGLKALGFTPYIYAEPAFRSRYVPDGEYLPTDKFYEDLLTLSRTAAAYGVKLYLYGLLWPHVRNGEMPDWDNEKWRTEVVYIFERMRRTLGDAVQFVDGTELFGVTAEDYRRDMARIWPSGLQYVDQDTFPYHSSRLHTGIQPAIGEVPYVVSCELLDTDGMGENRRKWTDGRAFMSLPTTGPVSDVVGWYRTEAAKARAAGTKVFLILHTTSWLWAPSDNSTGWIFNAEPRLFKLNVEPFDQVYLELGAVREPEKTFVSRHQVNPMPWPINMRLNITRWSPRNQAWDPQTPSLWHMQYGGGPNGGTIWIGRDIGSVVEFMPVEHIAPDKAWQVMTSEHLSGMTEDIWPGWVPQIGEEMYVMFTAPCLAFGETFRQRSDIVKVTWR